MQRGMMAGFLFLAACATPLEQCLSNASKDIRVISGLITTTQTNIDRGYAIRSEQYFTTEEQVCGESEGETIYCDVPVAQSRNVPVAIDLNAEAAKLASLITKRQELRERADAVIIDCNARYAEV